MAAGIPGAQTAKREKEGERVLEILFKSIYDAIWLQKYLSARGSQIMMSYTQSHSLLRLEVGTDEQSLYVEALAELIEQMKRHEWIHEILKRHFYYEDEGERSQIADIADAMLKGKKTELAAFIENRLDTGGEIRSAVAALFKQSGPVLFDHFLKFRLKAEYERLFEYVEIAIDEYKMEQEYQMFVQTLRDYIRNKEPVCREIHLELDESQRFYDENQKEMPSGTVQDMIDRRLLANHPVYIDSAVIAPLLSMSPEKIYVYSKNEDTPLIRTLQNIFEERLILSGRRDGRLHYSC